MIPRTLASTRSVRALRELRFDIVLDLLTLVNKSPTQSNPTKHTLVTPVPTKKNTLKSAKNTLHGCTACTTAVTNAVRIPTGVKDLRDQAR